MERNKKGQFFKGFKPWNKDKKGYRIHSEEFKEKKRVGMLNNKWAEGLVPWNKGLEGLQQGYKFPKGHIPWNKGKKFLQVSGNRNRNWRGGITPENEKIRKSDIYKEWRNKVLERDHYSCVLCGTKQSGRNSLIVDHIKPFSLYPELRFVVGNGRSLCKRCDDLNGFKWNRHLTDEENRNRVLSIE
jgi:hypothetical protein